MPAKRRLREEKLAELNFNPVYTRAKMIKSRMRNYQGVRRGYRKEFHLVSNRDELDEPYPDASRNYNFLLHYQDILLGAVQILAEATNFQVSKASDEVRLYLFKAEEIQILEKLKVERGDPEGGQSFLLDPEEIRVLGEGLKSILQPIPTT